jgi:glucose/arabinose dehydrogenase
MFVAERAGRVRVVRDGSLQPTPALTLDDVATSGEDGFLDLTIAPNFSQTHFLYAVYTSVGRAGTPVFSVARFREVADTAADRVVVLTDVLASPARAAAVVRFGPDDKLYAAFDDAGNARLRDDLASPNGKVLRLNADGTTPGDQPDASPIYSFPYQSPRSLAWQSASGLLWVADSESTVSTRLVAVTPGKGMSQRSAVAGTYELATEGRATGLVAYNDRLIPSFRDNLLVGADEGRDILRVRLDPQNPAGVVGVDRLLKGIAGNVRAVAVGPEGAIYFATPHAIARLRPMD